MKVNKIDHTPRKTGGATYSLDLGSNGLHREINKLEDTLYFCQPRVILKLFFLLFKQTIPVLHISRNVVKLGKTESDGQTAAPISFCYHSFTENLKMQMLQILFTAVLKNSPNVYCLVLYLYFSLHDWSHSCYPHSCLWVSLLGFMYTWMLFTVAAGKHGKIVPRFCIFP